MMLHAMNAALQGHQKVYIRSVDSDVVVPAIHFSHKLKVTELWVMEGHKGHNSELVVHPSVQTTVQRAGKRAALRAVYRP